MGDYKRLVSYMYNYDNGIKRNNIGYSRVESNNGQCKVTIRIKVTNMNEESLKVYFFKRNGYSIEGILLGEFTVKRGQGNFVTLTDSDNIMDSTYELDDIGGIVLYYTDKRYFATEWDDKPVTKEMVNDSLLISKKLSHGEEKTSKKDEAKYEHREQTELQVDKVVKRADIGQEEIKEEVKDEDITQEEIQVEDIIVKNIIDEEIKDEGQKNIDKEMSNNELQEDVIDNLSESTEIDSNEVDLEKFDFSELSEIKDPSKTKQDLQEKTYINNQQATKTTIKRPWKVFDEHPEALKIYNKYPKMYPFEDNEVAWCVRFEPQDIGVLPIDNWSMGNNSFLLHGFYCYSHLVFARINDKSGIQYILGVPGIYHNRERFMAKMFGFNFFKSIKRKELRTGEFGYWCAPIYFN